MWGVAWSGTEVMAKQYQIIVASHLDDSWAEWFAGLTISRLASGETLLSGELTDQAALHGVLTKIRDLGLALNAVTMMPEHEGRTRSADRRVG